MCPKLLGERERTRKDGTIVLIINCHFLGVCHHLNILLSAPSDVSQRSHFAVWPLQNIVISPYGAVPVLVNRLHHVWTTNRMLSTEYDCEAFFGQGTAESADEIVHKQGGHRRSTEAERLRQRTNSLLQLFIILPLISSSRSHSTKQPPGISVLIRQQMPQAIMQFPESRYQLLMGLKITGIGKIGNANANANANAWRRAS